ncbi:MAG: sigma-70 family RNA polymerase sigma factor [Clostridia bacterium]|nr:sigma-70 family RNA polymerase sigma factor [Clostridia bacterium]
MNLADRERVEVQLIGFCIRVIENEARNIHREINLRRRKEKTFSDLTESEMNQLSTTDTYFLNEQTFWIVTNENEIIKVVVVNSDLYDAMKRLPQDKLNIILHSYFLGKTDQEIANEAKVVQSTVCRRRQKILELLKELIAEEGG